MGASAVPDIAQDGLRGVDGAAPNGAPSTPSAPEKRAPLGKIKSSHSLKNLVSFGGGKKEPEKASTSAVRITYRDLDYAVPSRENKKVMAHLLKGVSGYFSPREMAALMGPSGCGKTTLLDVLSGRSNKGKIVGEVLFGGLKPTKNYFRRYTGYVEQFDTLLGILTVHEMLMYTAELKRSKNEPLASKRMAVDELIAKLGLTECKDVRIGSQAVKGISGGQAKRVNIGIALITNCRVLFLDEPTTGLDSFTANEVMSVCKSLTESGVTVVATIHSPTAFCFNLFDRVTLLLSGKTVYFGPRDAAIDFFSSNVPAEHVKAHTPGFNDSEYITDMVVEADRHGAGTVFSDAYDASELKRGNDAALEAYMQEKSDVPPETLRELQVESGTVTPLYWALWVFLRYRTTRNYSDPTFIIPRIADKLVIGLLIMTLYLGIGDNITSDNIINISAVLFMWAATPGFAASGYMPSLFLERAVFVRERADGLYLVVAYLIAKQFDEIAISAVAALPISAIMFYGVQLQGEFLLFYVSYVTALAVGIILAYFIASFAPSMDVANALLPTYAVTLLFFCGFLIPLNDIPPWWKWYSYINFAKYSWGANMINQFNDNDIMYLDGMTVLEYYGFANTSKWSFVGFTACFYIFFFIGTWLLLQFKSYQQR
ncbi:hypothetical protein FOA52_007815 [Chlamydomonas sp. UWO 241]|nr:hypothetical protein FOA52_007815 [Chlamydomonas sp. UWO 241]